MARVRALYDRRLVASLVAFAAASLVCVALVCVRMQLTGTTGYLFLVWNLFLAWIPFALACVLYTSPRSTRWSTLAVGAVWLLFVPNAPYIVTDLIHLRWRDGAPVWYDAVMVGLCAWTGLMLGMVSIKMMQSLARQHVGNVVSWAFALAVLGLCGFGIYLGRFERWNSWDILTNPSGLVYDIANRLVHPLANAHTYAVSLLFALVLLVVYLMTTAMQPGPKSPDSEP